MKQNSPFKILGKRRTLLQLQNEVGDCNIIITSAKEIRTLCRHAKYGRLVAIKIVRRLRAQYGINCIFMHGNRTVATCKDGFPTEAILQSYRVILEPFVCR